MVVWDQGTTDTTANYDGDICSTSLWYDNVAEVAEMVRAIIERADALMGLLEFLADGAGNSRPLGRTANMVNNWPGSFYPAGFT